MAWQEVSPIIGNSANAKHRVRYKVSKKFGCTVTIPLTMVEELGWNATGCRLRLSVGDGEVFGKLKLTDDIKALPLLQKSKGGGFMVKLGRWSQLPDREVERIAVEHQVDGRALVLTLPSHALNVAPAPRTATASNPAAKVDVTTKIAGANGNGGRPVSTAPRG